MLEPQREPADALRHPPRRTGQQHMSALAAQHLLHDTLGDSLGLQQRPEPAVLGRQVRDEVRAGEALRDQDGAHARRVVARDKLGGEALVEGDCGRFGGGVVDHVGRDGVAGLRGDGDDHAVVCGDEVRQELLGQPVVGEGVDLEHAPGDFRGRAEDRLAGEEAGVVDENGRAAERSPDRGAGFCDRVWRRDVALEEAHAVWQCVGWRGDV